MRLLLVFLSVCFISACATRPSDKETLHPKISYWTGEPQKSICILGDCQNGQGTLLTLNFVKGIKRPDPYHSGKFLKLTREDFGVITVYEGVFSNNGNRLKGKVYQTIKKARASSSDTDYFRFSSTYITLNKIKNSKSALMYSGDLRARKKTKSDSMFINYVPGPDGGKMIGYHSPAKRLITSVSIRPLKDHLYFANIEYDQHPTLKSFKGIVTLERNQKKHHVLPLLGEARYKNGDLYQGGLWQEKKLGFGKLVSGNRSNTGYFYDDKLQGVATPTVAFPDNFLASLEKPVSVQGGKWGLIETDMMHGFSEKDEAALQKSRFLRTALEIPYYWGEVLPNGELGHGTGIAVTSRKAWSKSRNEKLRIYNHNFFNPENRLYPDNHFLISTDFSSSGGERISDMIVGVADYEYLNLAGTIKPDSKFLMLSGCADYKINDQVYQGNFPLGWRIREDGTIAYKLNTKPFTDEHWKARHYYLKDEPVVLMPLFMKDINYKTTLVPDGYFTDGIALLEKAEKDVRYCSSAATPEKTGNFIRNFRASLAEATRARDEYRKYLAKIDAMSGDYLRKLQQEKADRMQVCHRCDGRGQLFENETNTTKFVPSFEYRNSMKIETRTSITTTRKRWVGVCPVCKGEGYIDPHEH